jgi:hypothetical protein
MLANILALIVVFLFILFPILIHEYTHRRIVRRFIEAGVVIPLLLLVVREAELFFNRETVPLAGLYGVYLWPSSLLLIGNHGSDWGAWLFVFFAIALNALLYAMIGYVVELTVFLFLKTRGNE